nr:hypothetical protein [uncultured Desulfobacter sp.]
MFDNVKTWFRPKEDRKYGGETAYGWAAALRYDFAYYDEVPDVELRRHLTALTSGVDLPVLICTHDDADVRILSIVLAAVESQSDCHMALIAALHDPLESVRRAAAIALVKMDTISGLAAVVAGHRHGHGIRTQAAYRLAEHGAAAADAIPALYALINYPDINWRSHMAANVALSAIGEKATPFLIHALQHGSDASKSESATALNQLGVPDELRSLVNDILGSESTSEEAR